jgi:predicted RNA binding protein YcfA (HicA-like mRNA interferase family)
MRAISGKEMCKILEQDGWELKTIKGSHHVYMKEGRKERISVPVHGNKSQLDLKTDMADVKTTVNALADAFLETSKEVRQLKAKG